MSLPAPRVVLFDLDGTLSDSAPGILAALRHAFTANALPPLDERTERAILGPPFYESLPPLIGDVPLHAIIDAYREHYGRVSMFETSLFAGMGEILDALRLRGVRLAVATSKPEHYALPIVDKLGLADHFVAVGGDTLDGARPTKALVIDHVLEHLGRPDPAEVLMVGDRSHDVIGAREHGIACAGAGWGYAIPGELAAAAPVAVCERPADLAALLRIDGCG